MPIFTQADLWHRIGSDGLPPVALDVYAGVKVCARIVDVTDYKDFPPDDPDQSPYIYRIELLVDGRFVAEPETYENPDIAFGAIVMLVG
jgi:hypothetical protein